MKQTPHYVANRPLARHNNTGMVAALPQPRGMEAGEMGDIEGEEHAPFSQCPLKLGFVRLATAANLWCRTDIDLCPTQRGGNRTVDILIREETNGSHQVEPPAIRRALADASSSAARAPSISSKWS